MTWGRKKGSGSGSRATAFFVLLGLVGSALLLTLAMQRVGTPRTSVTEELPPPDFSALLPADADASALSVMKIEDVPQPSYVVGYSRDGQAELALIRWDRQESRYSLASRMQLVYPPLKLETVSSIVREPLGTGAPSLILARGLHGGAYTQAVLPLIKEGDRLRMVARSNEDGTNGVAYFLEGASARNIEEFSLEDLTGDGVKEALATHVEVLDADERKSTVDVYVWKDGKLAYDKDLSWAYTTSRNLFPEPEAR